MSRTVHRPVCAPDLLAGHSIEVMPRTAAKVPDFRAILPEGTRIYIAHIDGTPLDDMVATARRLAGEGFAVMPHVPARSLPDLATLRTLLARYRDEAGVDQALVIAGGAKSPAGVFTSSIDLLRSGAFAEAGINRLHVAGHPEGNPDIDPQGGHAEADAALHWKAEFASESGVEMAIVTQFAFAAAPVFDWIERLRARGIDLPVHVGLAGPAKLQTMLKFAIACGVGPSISVLKKRARDLTALLKPYEPGEMLAQLEAEWRARPEAAPAQVHFFPLGGIQACTDWVGAQNAGRLRLVAG